MVETERKKYRKAADYEVLLAEHATSGMTLLAFAESKGIPPRTFYKWNQKLRPREPEKRRDRADLVEVQILETSSDDAVRDQFFELTISGGRVLSIPSGFDDEELRRLIAVLEPAC